MGYTWICKLHARIFTKDIENSCMYLIVNARKDIKNFHTKTINLKKRSILQMFIYLGTVSV